MKYKAVLFDMDGTVLDTLDDLADAVNRTLKEFALPQVSRDRVRAMLGNGAARLIRGCLPEGTPEGKEAEVLAWYREWYGAHCRQKTRPYPGIVPLMERLRAEGVKLAVISNKPDGAVKELAEAFFPGLLEQAVGESETVRRKPDPSAVLAAARLLGMDRQDCVYVGDSEVDAATAGNAGMDFIAVTWGFRGREELRAAGAQRLAGSAQALEELLR